MRHMLGGGAAAVGDAMGLYECDADEGEPGEGVEAPVGGWRGSWRAASLAGEYGLYGDEP